MYHFFVDINGETRGPYSAKDMLSMNLPSDTAVTEDSLNGEWYYAGSFDFEELSRNELFADEDVDYNNQSETTENMVSEKNKSDDDDWKSTPEHQKWREEHQKKE